MRKINQATVMKNLKKSNLNLLLLLSFLIALSLSIWLNYQTTNSVGDISFNKEIDSPTFKICNEKKILQYYSVKSNYKNGRRAIKKEIWKTIENLTFEKSGFITFRFIINCKGETGRFRIKTINSELKTQEFDAQKIKTLQNTIEKLKNWNAGIMDDKTFDSYYVLNFKIEKGKITDIF